MYFCCQIDNCVTVNWLGSTVLHIAAEFGHKAIVECLVQNNSSIDEKNNCCKYPFIYLYIYLSFYIFIYLSFPYFLSIYMFITIYQIKSLKGEG